MKKQEKQKRSLTSFYFIIIGVLFLYTQTLFIGMGFIINFFSFCYSLIVDIVNLFYQIIIDNPITTTFILAIIIYDKNHHHWKTTLVQLMADAEETINKNLLCEICKLGNCQFFTSTCQHAYHNNCLSQKSININSKECPQCLKTAGHKQKAIETKFMILRNKYKTQFKWFVILSVGVGLYNILQFYLKTTQTT